MHFCQWLHATMEIRNRANKLTDDNKTNLTNLARWLVFALDHLAGAGEIGFLIQSGSDWCACYSHVQRAQSFLSLPLSSDVLIHPVLSTQTLRHTAFYFTCTLSPPSPPIPSLSLHCFVHMLILPTYTCKLTPPANLPPTKDWNARIICHL